MEEYEWRVSFTGDFKLARSLSPVQREIMHILKALISEPQYNQEIREKGINLTNEFWILPVSESDVFEDWTNKFEKLETRKYCYNAVSIKAAYSVTMNIFRKKNSL